MNDVKIIVTDVDGTLTDGKYHVHSNGMLTKSFDTRDFFALQKAQKDGLRVLILTSATDSCAIFKSQQTNIDIISASKDKVADLQLVLDKYKLSWNNVLFIGDAETDFAAMKKSGFAACPCDAIPEVRKNSDYVCDARGGKSSVYEVIRYLYEQQGKKWL